MNIYRTKSSFVIIGITHLTKSGQIAAWFANSGALLGMEIDRGNDNPKPIPSRWKNVVKTVSELGKNLAKDGKIGGVS